MARKSLQMFSHSNYLRRVFDPSDYLTLISKAIITFDEINEGKHKLDAVVFTGISGASIGFPLCYAKQVSPICLRKEKSEHATFQLEGPKKSVKNYIIVDDVIDTGKTIMGLLEIMVEYGSVCRGILLTDVYSRYGNMVFEYGRRKIPVYEI